MATTTTREVQTKESGKKYFVPLENNPEVFTDLIHRLGVSDKLGFYDVYSVDEPDLLAMVPRPAHALIFIAPSPIYNKVRAKYDGGVKDISYDKCGEGEPVIWFRQTIGNACGLYSLVHAVGNGTTKQFIKPDSLIDSLLKEALPLKRVERADVLYKSKALEQAHMASAVGGDSYVPEAAAPIGYHFITFVKGNDGHLWELEGGWNPIDRGVLDDSEDMLSGKALELGMRKYLQIAAEDGNAEFSIVACCTRDCDLD